MQHKYCFKVVHRLLCYLRKTDEIDGPLFGGVPVLLGGDFAQILPVVTNGDRTRTVEASLQKCFLWPRLKILQLTEHARSSGYDQ